MKKVNISLSVSISETNQNFSKLARLVDENGAIVILKNNKPKYILVEYSQLENEEYFLDGAVEEVANKIPSRHIKAIEGLAK